MSYRALACWNTKQPVRSSQKIDQFFLCLQNLCSLLLLGTAEGLLSFPLRVKRHAFRSTAISKGNAKYFQSPTDISMVTQHTLPTHHTHLATFPGTHNMNNTRHTTTPICLLIHTF